MDSSLCPGSCVLYAQERNLWLSPCDQQLPPIEEVKCAVAREEATLIKVHERTCNNNFNIWKKFACVLKMDLTPLYWIERFRM
jgi:hypothetical protein